METLVLIERTGEESVVLSRQFFSEFKINSQIIVLAAELDDANRDAIESEVVKSGRTFRETGFNDFFTGKMAEDVILIRSGYGKVNDENKAAASLLCSYLHPDSVIVYSRYPLLRNVNGEIVPDAYVIDELSFEEAESLLYYGAPMIDITNIYSVVKQGVKVLLKSFREDGSTLISSKPSVKAGKKTIKGFATIYGVSILTLEGIGFKGVAGITSRLANACSEVGVSFLMIGQGASESAISVVVKDKDAAVAAMNVNKAFEKEILSGISEPVKIDNNNAIIAAVGDRITDSARFVSSFYSAFSSFNIHVKLSTLTGGDNSLCAVIGANDIKKALSGLHASFCLSKVTISLGLFGAGNVGREFLSQIHGQQKELGRRGIDIRVRAISNSRKMLLSDSGIDLSDWKKEFERSAVPLDVDKMVDFIDIDAYPNSLVVDCTSSNELPLKYIDWFERGIHIITPNKKAGVTDYKYYSKMIEAAKKNNVMYLHEATVGAGLPVISTLVDMLRTGDKVRKISGIVSGTLGYLFSRYDGTVPFSQLVLQAKEMGYTESDPREDLSGMDVARKTVILSREMGFAPELCNMEVFSLVPQSLRTVPYDEFVKRIGEIDKTVEDLFSKAKKEGKVLRYTGEVGRDGICSVGLFAYETSHIFARTDGTDNVIVFETERYLTEKMVIRGPGAGIKVTAAGVFADLLRLCSNLGAAV